MLDRGVMVLTLQGASCADSNAANHLGTLPFAEEVPPPARFPSSHHHFQSYPRQPSCVLACRSLTLKVHSLKKARMVRRLKVHFCAHPVSELSELKTRSDLWQQVSPLHLPSTA